MLFPAGPIVVLEVLRIETNPNMLSYLAAGPLEDLITLENFTYGDTPTEQSIASLLDDVLGRGATFDVSNYDLSGEHDLRGVDDAAARERRALQGP